MHCQEQQQQHQQRQRQRLRKIENLRIKLYDSDLIMK